MLTKRESSALVIALAKSIREFVPVSDNIKNIPLEKEYDKEVGNTIWHKIQHDKPVSPMKYFEQIGKRTLKEKVGRCEPLMTIAADLLRITKIKNSSGTYFSAVSLTSDHAFGVLHNTNWLKDKSEDFVSLTVSNSLEEFCSNFLSDSDYIFDPWIWFAGNAKEYAMLQNRISEFGVEENYAGTLELKYMIPLRSKETELHLIGEKHNTNEKLKKYQGIFGDLQKNFLSYYKEEKQRNTLAPYQPDFSLIKKTAQNYVMLQLAGFTSYIKGSMSNWYSSFGHSNRKGKALQKILDFCTEKTETEEHLTNEEIYHILQILTAIVLIPRGETEKERKILKITTLKQTKTGLAALEALISYRFPAINRLISHFYFYAIDSYNALIEFAGIGICRLYENKDYYYSQAEQLESLITQKMYSNNSGYEIIPEKDIDYHPSDPINIPQSKRAHPINYHPYPIDVSQFKEESYNLPLPNLEGSNSDHNDSDF